MSSIIINLFTPNDQSALQTLLRAARLSTEDLTPMAYQDFLVARDGDRVVGVAGLERHGQSGLLRSVAVDPATRGIGIGKQLVAAAEAKASQLGIRRIYLLTTTADKFFGDLGYSFIARDQAPVAIACTAQFSNLCPTSSRFMTKRLA